MAKSGSGKCFATPVLGANNKTLLKLDHLTILQHSQRFDSGVAIGQLVKQVIAGNRVKSLALLLVQNNKKKPASAGFFR